jgi:phosphosulfolactate phosphohydrolase-like enzyme
LFAGAVASKLQAEFELDDPSELLRFSYEEQGSSLLNKLRLSNHFNRLSGFGNEADVRFCCQLNSHTVIPRFENGVFIKA